MYNQDTLKKAQDMQPSEALLQMITSSWISQAICVAAQLGIADLLKNGSKSSEDLAKATGTNAQSLYRLLRALSSVSIFAEVENASFELTPLASYLQTNVPGSVHPLAIMFGKEWHSLPWLNLLHSLKTGNTAFKYVYGMELFEYLEKNPETARIFNDAMSSTIGALQADIDITTIEYDFSSIHKIVEVGGGHGSLIAAILKRYPTMQGILFDLPPVVVGAKHLIDAEGLTERCQIVGGNFFESLPYGGNIYILKHIIHDWDDTHAIAILNNCRHAMAENGKLLLIEAVIPSKNKPSFGKFLDLEMLVISGGCERTEIEYQTIFEAAGFRLTKVIPTKSLLSVIEGIPI
jgi:O-methyltransferase domain/Dimerisation domain